jgi:hypothetical protein
MKRLRALGVEHGKSLSVQSQWAKAGNRKSGDRRRAQGEVRDEKSVKKKSQWAVAVFNP